MQINKYLYVIAPTRRCFSRWCQENEKNSESRDLIHISDPFKLLGRYIRDRDEIHYYNEDCFDPGMLEEIEYEISVRSSKCHRDGRYKTKLI